MRAHTILSSDTPWIGDLPLTPVADAVTLERFAGITLKLSADGYYAVHAGGVLICASPDRAHAVREFWSACHFD